MHPNDTNKNPKILYPELSYKITGLLFAVHNALDRYAKERQYGDAFESLLQEAELPYEREKPLPLVLIENQNTNRADFVIDSKILLEIKAKPFITKDDYYQTQRYLQAGNYELGLIVNFRSRYLKPTRVIRTGRQ